MGYKRFYWPVLVIPVCRMGRPRSFKLYQQSWTIDIFEPIEAIAMTPWEWENSQSPLVEYARNGQVL